MKTVSLNDTMKNVKLGGMLVIIKVEFYKNLSIII
jgi:hypothetical protein